MSMNMNLYKLFALAVVASVLVSCLPVQAQEKQTETTLTVPVIVDTGPEDALERGNPRSSIIGFLAAANEFNWEKAAEYLDLRNLPADIMEIVKSAGTSFALPGRAIFMEGDKA